MRMSHHFMTLTAFTVTGSVSRWGLRVRRSDRDGCIHPVSESIYHQYYEEARYRPSVITRQRFIAKQLGRKTGKGFYDYTSGAK
jgi:3-hydroxyacyl-CoA dehydrogenase